MLVLKIHIMWTAFTKDHELFSFTGKRFWKIRRHTIQPGYPKPLRHLGLPSYVSSVDAAVHLTYSRKTLFFVNNMYWRWVNCLWNSHLKRENLESWIAFVSAIMNAETGWIMATPNTFTETFLWPKWMQLLNTEVLWEIWHVDTSNSGLILLQEII